MILSAQSIRKLVKSRELVIEPFSEQKRAYGLSYGLGPCGYDIRLGAAVTLWPFVGRLSFALERIALPDWIRGKVENKSTLARLFVDASRTTNLEPGWGGHLTLELSRDYPWPIHLPAGMPIAQVVFERLDESTEQPYAATAKYQDQPARAVPALFR